MSTNSSEEGETDSEGSKGSLRGVKKFRLLRSPGPLKPEFGNCFETPEYNWKRPFVKSGK